MKFESSPNDPCLYTRHKSSTLLFIALYVDDLLIVGNSSPEIEEIKKELSRRFEMKDLGPPRKMLGIEIKRDRSSRRLFVSQSEYTEQILSRFGMLNSKPISTPMDRSYEEFANQEPDPIENIPYRQVIGSLMYLMVGSRADIAFAVGKLSQHSQSPSKYHWVALKRVLRYINGTRNFGILYSKRNDLTVNGFSDADWAGCRKSRKSTSDLVFIVSGGAVCWRSKKQTCIATSTCEAEYIAMCMATKESIWLSRLLADLANFDETHPISLRIDNDGAIDTAKNASINQRNKHIDLQYHFVRNAHKQKRISLKYVQSSDQIADSLTKPLDSVLFTKHRASQGICDVPF